MPKSTRAQRARDAVGAAGNNPYLRRLIEDEDLRDSLRDAVDAARDAYSRLSSNGSVIDAAIDDKKVHRDLKAAAENLRDASQRLRGEDHGAVAGEVGLGLADPVPGHLGVFGIELDPDEVAAVEVGDEARSASAREGIQDEGPTGVVVVVAGCLPAECLGSALQAFLEARGAKLNIPTLDRAWAIRRPVPRVVVTDVDDSPPRCSALPAALRG